MIRQPQVEDGPAVVFEQTSAVEAPAASHRVRLRSRFRNGGAIVGLLWGIGVTVKAIIEDGGIQMIGMPLLLYLLLPAVCAGIGALAGLLLGSLAGLFVRPK